VAFNQYKEPFNMFVIKTETSRKIVAGKMVEESFSYIEDDATGELVGKKAHATEAEAQLELDGLGHFESALTFAKAQFPDMSAKAQIGKANVVAEYLSWEAAGRPVKEPKPAGEVKADEPVVEGEAAVEAEETF
jgi:hypothetical protein